MAKVKKSTYQQNNQAVHFAFTGMPKQNAYFPTFEIKFPPKTWTLIELKAIALYSKCSNAVIYNHLPFTTSSFLVYLSYNIN